MSYDVSMVSSRGDLAYTPIRRGDTSINERTRRRRSETAKFLFAKTLLHSSWKAVQNESKNTYLLKLP